MKRAPLIDQPARCVPTARRRGGAVAIGDDPFFTLEIEIRVVGLTIHHMVLVWVRRPSGPVDLEAETAKPAAHTRAESRGSPRTRAAWGERQTLRWREMDSNLRFRAKCTALR